MASTYIVGLTGGSASGKSHFLNQILQDFKEDEICHISQDHYYFPREEQPVDENGIKNFDSPACIDFQKFVKDIKTVRDGKSVTIQEYTFNNPKAISNILEFKPAPIMLVEGIFVFYQPQVAELLDLKLFIDAQEHIKLSRRITRDREERGYDMEDVMYRYENHVAPTYIKYIEPYKHSADLIIPNNQQFEQALQIVKTFLRSKV